MTKRIEIRRKSNTDHLREEMMETVMLRSLLKTEVGAFSVQMMINKFITSKRLKDRLLFKLPSYVSSKDLVSSKVRIYALLTDEIVHLRARLEDVNSKVKLREVV